MAVINTRSQMTQAEVDAFLAREAPELEVVLKYTISEDGTERCEPPLTITVTCRPEREDGIRRTVSKLLESRGWAARLETWTRARRAHG